VHVAPQRPRAKPRRTLPCFLKKNYFFSHDSYAYHLQNPAVAIVRPTFQKLVHAVLQSKWKYFNNASQPDVAAARLVQFSSLLESIAGGLQSNDIETFQLNLRALEKLNEITKLYQRVRLLLSKQVHTTLRILCTNRISSVTTCTLFSRSYLVCCSTSRTISSATRLSTASTTWHRPTLTLSTDRYVRTRFFFSCPIKCLSSSL